MSHSPYGRRGRPGRWHGHPHGGRAAYRDAMRAARYDHRYDHRRMRRLHRRGGPGHPAAALAVIAGVVLLTGGTVGLVLTAVAQLLALVVLGVLVYGAFTLVRGSRRRAVQANGQVPPMPQAAVGAEESWRRARADFQRVRGEFGAHELDPMAVLRRPALSDVSVPSTARFVDALAAAQALDTDGYPGEPYGASYVRAVEVARRSWQAAVEAADRIRLSGLDPDERRTVERVLKLLTTARDSDSEPERLAAYARARSELDRLDRAGVVHLPKPARAELDARARGELPGSA